MYSMMNKDLLINNRLIHVGSLCNNKAIYPCLHHVVLYSGERGVWTAIEIAKYLKQNKLPVPKHFAEYV